MKLLKKIKINITNYKPKIIISLGDSFHENSTLKTISKNNIRNINQVFKNREVYFIDGNHDSKLESKEKINVIFKESLKLKNFNFIHVKNTNVGEKFF